MSLDGPSPRGGAGNSAGPDLRKTGLARMSPMSVRGTLRATADNHRRTRIATLVARARSSRIVKVRV